MFHRIERIDYPALAKLNELAYWTVAFGLHPQTAKTVKALKSSFIKWLDDHGFPQAGEWLWNKPVKIRKPLLELVKQSNAAKQTVLTAFDTDRDLEQSFYAGHFAFTTLAPDCQVARDCVAEILQNFYQDILAAKDGTPGDMIGERANCTRQDVLKQYLKKNQKLKVCPGCDGSPPSIDHEADMIREDVDHFFAKSKYPLWAIHPLNLTPFCKDCNQTYKGQKDAILDADDAVNDVISPEYMYHPYLRPACDDIAVTVVTDAATRKPHLQLKTYAEDPVQEARLHSLNYLLNLESRWNGDLQAERLQEHVKIGLAYCTQDERDHKTLSDELIREKLGLVARTIGRSVGKLPGQIPAAAYAQWLMTDETAQNERIRLAQQEME